METQGQSWSQAASFQVDLGKRFDEDCHKEFPAETKSSTIKNWTLYCQLGNPCLFEILK